MRRRDCVAALLSGALSGTAPTYSHELARRLGVLMGPPEGDADGEARVAGLRHGLEAAGWIEGQKLHIEYRWGASEGQTAVARAADLLAQRPEVILVNTPAGLAAIQKLTTTLPVVFVQFVGEGFIESLARPGGNITGFTMLQERLDEKWLEILREIAPQTRRVAFMQNPDHPSWPLYHAAITATAPKLGMMAFPTRVRTAGDVEQAIAEFAREPDGAVIVLPATFNTAHRKLIIEQAARHRLPAIYPNRFYAADGGLVSYGGDLPDLMRQAASYVDRILRGADPGNLPVQQTTKLELVLNLKTASALGLKIPPSLLARADEVIE